MLVPKNSMLKDVQMAAMKETKILLNDSMRELHREPHSLARGFTFVETALKSRSCSGVVCEHEWFEDRSPGVVIAPILEY